MGPAQAIRTCFQEYSQFSGRAARPEFWGFIGAFVTLSLLISLVILNLDRAPDAVDMMIENAFALVFFVPFLAAPVRRLHDPGRSGFAMLAAMVSVVVARFQLTGGIPGDAFFRAAVTGKTATFGVVALQTAVTFLALWWLTCAAQPFVNQYGANPSEAQK